MTAILVDVATYGALSAIAFTVLKVLKGRYYGRKNQPKPEDPTNPSKDKE